MSQGVEYKFCLPKTACPPTWLKLRAQDSAFSILVIQDHIESIGKPILLKGDEVLLNGLLAQNA